MQAIKYHFDHQEYAYEYDDHQIIQSINRAEVTAKDADELLAVAPAHDLFLPVEIGWESDRVTLTSTRIPGRFVQDVPAWTTAMKLRLLVNLLPVRDLLLTGELTTNLHPHNIYLDANNVPHLLYRGIPGMMPGAALTDTELVRQFQCLAGALFTGRSFDDLYNGLLAEGAKQSQFMTDLLQITTMTDMAAFLKEQAAQAATNEEEMMVRVPRKRYMVTRQLALWLGVACVLLLIPLGYLLLSKVPTDNACLAADHDFQAENYDQTIKDLQHVKLKHLPQTQKYELARAYIADKGFNHTQRTNILKNVTLNAAPTYLNYWIEDGRGQLDDALATAKQLQDTNLIMYALLGKIDAVKQNKHLSAQKREQQLESLQKQYTHYQRLQKKHH